MPFELSFESFGKELPSLSAVQDRCFARSLILFVRACL